jgi:hypothetical protein
VSPTKKKKDPENNTYILSHFFNIKGHKLWRQFVFAVEFVFCDFLIIFVWNYYYFLFLNRFDISMLKIKNIFFSCISLS